MATIETGCPQCGTVSLRPQQITLLLDPAQPDGDRYTFRCPACDRRVDKPADARAVTLLCAGGVEPIFVDEHPEAPPSAAPPLTYDDLLALHQRLQDDGWFGELEALT